MKFSYNDFARLYKINYLKRKSPKPKTFAESLRDISIFIETLKEIIKDNNFESLTINGLGTFNKAENLIIAIHPITHRKIKQKKNTINFIPDQLVIKELNKRKG